MKKTVLLTAAALLIASSAVGYAQSRGTGSMGTTRGASEFSPGDQMRDSGGPKPGARGASEFSPGDRMRDSGTTGRGSRRGASEFAPGDKMNDKRGR